MRAFLGVPLPALDALQVLLEELRSTGPDLKVVAAHQLHLTLKFLGDVAESFASQFFKAFRARPLGPSFELRVRDVGAFPDWKKLHVLWAGLEDPTGGLTRLFRAAEEAWVGLGMSPEGREFSPHLTLARSRSNHSTPRVREVLERYRQKDFGTASVDRVRLYRSTLTIQGPVYDVVEEVAL